MEIDTFLTVFFGSVVGGAFVNFIFELGKRIFDEHLYRSRLELNDNRVLAQKVIDVVVEGHSSGHLKEPKSAEKILEVAARLHVLSESYSRAMKSYYFSWELFSTISANKSSDDKEFLIELEKELKERGNDLLKIAKKLKK